MRDNLRCLVCGSNRFATFRNGPAYSQQQIFYDNTTPSKGNNESSKKTVFNSDYDLLKANEQFKKLLDEGEEDETPKVDATDEHTSATQSDHETDEKHESGEKNDPEEKHEPTIEEIAKSLKKVHIRPLIAPAYDMSKSFFDDISCESKEKADGSYVPRQWQFERARNQQTFGVGGYNPRPNHYGGPMQRGGGFYPQQRNYKWQQEHGRNQQTFGPTAYNSRPQYGIPSFAGSYYQRNWQPKRRDYVSKELFPQV